MSETGDWEAELPTDLQSSNYDYPEALFDDHKDKLLRYDGGDDIPAPITNGERPLLMARYAVSKTLEPTWADSTHIKIARGDVGVNLVTAIRKIWDGKYRGYGGLERGDIELAADSLGVYELIWPFDPKKMAEAEKAEEQLDLEEIAA